MHNLIILNLASTSTLTLADGDLHSLRPVPLTCAAIKFMRFLCELI